MPCLVGCPINGMHHPDNLISAGLSRLTVAGDLRTHCCWCRIGGMPGVQSVVWNLASAAHTAQAHEPAPPAHDLLVPPTAASYAWLAARQRCIASVRPSAGFGGGILKLWYSPGYKYAAVDPLCVRLPLVDEVYRHRLRFMTENVSLRLIKHLDARPPAAAGAGPAGAPAELEPAGTAPDVGPADPRGAPADPFWRRKCAFVLSVGCSSNLNELINTRQLLWAREAQHRPTYMIVPECEYESYISLLGDTLRANGIGLISWCAIKCYNFFTTQNLESRVGFGMSRMAAQLAGISFGYRARIILYDEAISCRDVIFPVKPVATGVMTRRGTKGDPKRSGRLKYTQAMGVRGVLESDLSQDSASETARIHKSAGTGALTGTEQRGARGQWHAGAVGGGGRPLEQLVVVKTHHFFQPSWITSGEDKDLTRITLRARGVGRAPEVWLAPGEEDDVDSFRAGFRLIRENLGAKRTFFNIPLRIVDYAKLREHMLGILYGFEKNLLVGAHLEAYGIPATGPFGPDDLMTIETLVTRMRGLMQQHEFEVALKEKPDSLLPQAPSVELLSSTVVENILGFYRDHVPIHFSSDTVAHRLVDAPAPPAAAEPPPPPPGAGGGMDIDDV